MRFTKKTIIGIRALADVAANQTDRPVKLKEISERLRVSDRFLQQILGTLIRHGLLQSRRGPSGGYLLNRAAHEISVHDVLSVTEGPLEIVPCVGTENPDRERCPPEGRCAASPAWDDMHGQMVHLFQQVTLRDLYG